MSIPSFLVGKDAPLPKLSRTFPTDVDETLALGLDLGVGSCGQALVYDSEDAKKGCQIKGLPVFPGRIAFLGVRAFDVPETREKTGIKLKNPERRQKKRLRITTRRRAWRMWEIRKLLKSHGLLPSDYPTDKELWKRNPPRGENPELDQWRDWHSRMTEGQPGVGSLGPLELRVKGLDEKLQPLEWASTLLHLAKHRGFKSNRKSESVDDEGGKVMKALGENKRRMVEGGYRTVGEMLLKHSDFSDRKRNHEGVYLATPLRAEQEKEIHLLFQSQREFGNPLAGADFEKAYLAFFSAQYPLQNPLNLLGDCPFEDGEKRSPRYAPSFELSRALQKLNHLWVIPPDGGKVRLADYINAASGGYDTFIAEFGSKGTKSEPGRITWTDLRSIFGLPNDMSFADLPTPKRKIKKDGTEEIQSVEQLEKEDFVTRSNANAAAKGTFLLKQVVREGLFDELNRNDPSQLDRVAYALSFFEQIENDHPTEKHWGVLNQMRADGLDPRLIEDIEADLRSAKPTLAKFSGTTSMSVKACQKLIPHLKKGVIYSDACAAEYGDHRQTDFDFSSITNPVVKAVVRECLKQVVHLIDQTGKLPGRICVEIGRDLGKSVTERNEMARGIHDRTVSKNANRANLKDHLHRDPNRDELNRYELWLEQSDHCPYCGERLGKPIDILNEEFEVDHILPRSRSHDNSYDNQILVHRRCNRDKKDATPFEFSRIGNGDKESTGWKEFTAIVSTLKGIRKQKRRNLLNTTFAEDEATVASRHLNDTRYIARLVTHYLQGLYQIAGETPVTEKGGKKRVFVQPGALTALVRQAWGLENLKKDLNGNRIGDKHHAVDALICALLSESQRQFVTRREQKKHDAVQHSGVITEFSRQYRLMEDRNDHHRVPGKMDPPWAGFRHDVATAVDLFTVSRRENRRGRGGLHNDTIYRVEKVEGKEVCYSRKPLIDTGAGRGKPVLISLDDLDRIKDIDLPCNQWLKSSLTAWIEAGSPVNEEGLPRDPQGAIIRKVTISQGKKSGRHYPQGYVTGGDQVRLDVFSQTNQRGQKNYYLVPVYSYHLNRPEPPFRAITAHKDEEDWDTMDETYEFEFSLWSDSRFFVRKKNGEETNGSYCSVHRAIGRIEYSNPDDQSECPSPPKNGRKTPGVAVKTGVTEFFKINVDRLGRESPIESEKRTWRGKTVS